MVLIPHPAANANRSAASMQISIGKTIMLYRKNKNWSQSDLGEAAGISRNYVSMIECDDANVTIGTLEAVCAVLGISLSIVLGGSESHLTKRALDFAGTCREITHFYVDGICAHCGQHEAQSQ